MGAQKKMDRGEDEDENVKKRNEMMMVNGKPGRTKIREGWKA